MIPHIIHQSWKTDLIPEQWSAWQKTWLRHHPDYKYHFWTDADNRAFIASHYPAFLKLYDGYDLDICRADLARYLVLHHHGGVYADMDFEALRPIDELIAHADLVFGLEPPSHAARAPARSRGIDRIVCNAFMASVPRHPFWDHLLPRLAAAGNQGNVLDATGPFLLTHAAESYRNRDSITLVPASLLYPLDNEEVRSLDAATKRAKCEGAFAVHHWSGSWMRQSVLMYARRAIARSRRGETFTGS